MTVQNISINLIPPEIYARRRAEKVIFYVIFSFVALVVFLILLYVFNTMRINEAKDTLDIKKSQNDQILRQIETLKPYKERKDLAATKEQTLQTVLTGQLKYFKILNELAIVVPSNSQVESVTLAGTSLTMSGGVEDVVGDFPDNAFKDLADFWVKMENVDTIDNTFVGNYVTQSGVLPFNVTANINIASPSIQ